MKKLLIIIFIIILLLIGTVIAVPFFIDVNKYKGKISQIVTEKTGKKLEIEGDISFSIFPSISLNVGKTRVLGDKEGDKDIVSLSEFVLKLKLKPLLNKKVEVNEIKLVEPKINLVVANNGTKNWDIKKTAKSSKDKKKNDPDQALDIQEILKVDSVTIQNAHVSYTDKTNGTKVALKDFNLATAFNALDNPISIDTKYSLYDSKYEDFSLKGTYSVDLNGIYKLTSTKINLAGTKATISATADITANKPYINFNLNSDEINIDKLISKINVPVSKKPETKVAKNNNTSSRWTNEPIDLSAMKSVNADVAIKIGKIIKGDLVISNVETTTKLNNGVSKTKVANVDIFDGKIFGDMQVDASGSSAKIKENITIDGLNLESIPASLAPVAQNAGGIFSTKIILETKGKSQKQFVENLNGTTNLSLKNINVKKIDFTSKFKNPIFAPLSQTLVKIKKVEDINTNFNIKNGVITNDDASIATNFVSFKANGFVDLPKWMIDYKVSPKVAVASKLGVPAFNAPIIIKGPLDKPKITTDLKDSINRLLLQDPAKLKEKLKNLEDNAKNLGKNLEDNLKGNVDNQVDGALKNIGINPKDENTKEAVDQIKGLFKGL